MHPEHVLSVAMHCEEFMFLGQGYEVEMNKSRKKIVFRKIEYT